MNLPVEIVDNKAVLKVVPEQVVQDVTGQRKREMVAYLVERNIPVTEESLCYAAINTRPREKQAWTLVERFPHWNKQIQEAMERHQVKPQDVKVERIPVPEPTDESRKLEEKAKAAGFETFSKQASVGPSAAQGQRQQSSGSSGQTQQATNSGAGSQAGQTSAAPSSSQAVPNQQQSQGSKNQGQQATPGGAGNQAGPAGSASNGQGGPNKQQQATGSGFKYRTTATQQQQPQATQSVWVNALMSRFSEHIVKPVKSFGRVLEKAFFQHAGVVQVDDVKRFIEDTRLRPRYECRAAARKAVRLTPSTSFSPFEAVDHLLGAAEKAYKLARQPKVEIPKRTAVIVSKSAAAAMSDRERKQLEKLAGKNGWLLRLPEVKQQQQQQNGQTQTP